MKKNIIYFKKLNSQAWDGLYESFSIDYTLVALWSNFIGLSFQWSSNRFLNVFTSSASTTCSTISSFAERRSLFGHRAGRPSLVGRGAETCAADWFDLLAWRRERALICRMCGNVCTFLWYPRVFACRSKLEGPVSLVFPSSRALKARQPTW